MTAVSLATASRQALWRAARNILAIRLDTLGDVLMSTPALQALKGGSPHTRLTLLASRAGAALARHVPAIDEVMVYEAPWVKEPAHGDLSDRRLVAALRRGHFDAAVILTDQTQSALPAALMCRLAGIPLRLAHCREHPHGLLTDWLPDGAAEADGEGPRHEVARQLDLVRSVGFHTVSERLMFRYAASDVLSMRRKFQSAGGDLTRPYIVVHPGASSAPRRWPAERFGEAADTICRDSGCQAVFSGGHDETALVQLALSRTQRPSLSLAGQLTLGELAALIAGAQVTLCHGGGPAHMAAALDSPVVVVHAAAQPQHAPWRTRAHVLHHAQAQADDVAEAALDLLDAPPAVWHLPAAAEPMPAGMRA